MTWRRELKWILNIKALQLSYNKSNFNIKILCEQISQFLFSLVHGF